MSAKVAGSVITSNAAKYCTLESAIVIGSVMELRKAAEIDGVSAGFRFSAMDCRKVEACVLESASVMASVTLPKKLLPLLFIVSAIVIGSEIDWRNAEAWVLESARLMFSDMDSA